MSTGEVGELARGDPSKTKGVWRGGRSGPDTVKISCPDCGFAALLDHQVDQYGVVRPSVVCPAKGCSFHRMIRLLDWSKR